MPFFSETSVVIQTKIEMQKRTQYPLTPKLGKAFNRKGKTKKEWRDEDT